MPTLFVFLLKVNVALLLFCAGYYLVLRHLTFYTLNRIYLMAAILFASIYPQINLSDFLQRHQEIAKPVQQVAFNWQAPAKAFIKPLAQPNYWIWAEGIFWLGVVLLTMRLLMQLFSLYKLYRNSRAAQIYEHDVRVVDSDTSPFSFWKSIYINPNRHEPSDLRSILLHEQVHVSEWHTLDILLAELSTIFYWFNPGVWLMKKAVRENIEFITDRKILRNGADSKQYQYSLVNVGFAPAPSSIVNHFNISTIKKRIIMMNTKRSSRFKLTRYAFLVPAVVVLLLVFSISKAELVKKSNSVYKALKSTLTVTVKAVTPATSKNIKSNSKLQGNVALTTAINTKAVTVKGLDTIRKGNVFISTDEKSDSLNYVINGVKSTKADFKKLDPNKIYSIGIVSAESANKIIDLADKKHGALFITTDDSESGKKFKEKVDKLYNNNAYTLVSALKGNGSVNDVNKVVIASSSKDLDSDDDDDLNTVTIAGTNGKTNKNDIKVFTLFKSTHTLNGTKPSIVTINGHNRNVMFGKDSVMVFTINGEDSVMTRGMVIHGARGKNSAMTFSKDSLFFDKKMANPKFAQFKVLYNTNGFKSLNGFNNETNISHLSTRLIMIDGKEASEKDLKKLSAADIESMSARSGDEIVKKYGDKAKKGVLFITTKKAK